jgi:hypothetical protein
MKRTILAVGFVALSATGALAQWGGYRDFGFGFGGDRCWRAQQQAREYEWAARRDGRVTRDEWHIIYALREQANRACYLGSRRRYFYY